MRADAPSRKRSARAVVDSSDDEEDPKRQRDPIGGLDAAASAEEEEEASDAEASDEEASEEASAEEASDPEEEEAGAEEEVIEACGEEVAVDTRAALGVGPLRDLPIDEIVQKRLSYTSHVTSLPLEGTDARQIAEAVERDPKKVMPRMQHRLGFGEDTDTTYHTFFIYNNLSCGALLDSKRRRSDQPPSDAERAFTDWLRDADSEPLLRIAMLSPFELNPPTDAADATLDALRRLKRACISHHTHISFGKHKGLTREELRDAQPRYADWVMVSGSHYSGANFTATSAWLKAQHEEPAARGTTA